MWFLGLRASGLRGFELVPNSPEDLGKFSGFYVNPSLKTPVYHDQGFPPIGRSPERLRAYFDSIRAVWL